MDMPLNMQRTILKAALSAAVAGIPGAFVGPAGDLPMLAATWTTAAVVLATQAGKTLEEHTAAKLVTAVLAGTAAFTGGVKLGAQYLTVSTIGTVPGIILNLSANGLITWLALRAMAQVFIEEDLEESTANLARAVLSTLGGMVDLRG